MSIGNRGRSYVEKQRTGRSTQCWAMRRVYVGSLIAQYVRCSKGSRPGFRTCWHHQALEEKARTLDAEPSK